MSTSIAGIKHITLFCLAALLTGCINGDARFRETRNLSAPHESGKAIRVTTPNGDVTLLAGAGPDVQIEARVKCYTQERLDQTQVLATRVDGTLNIEVSWPEGKRQSGEGCSFTITLPDATGVEVQTSNGEISSTGLAGAAKLNTNNGEITVVRHDGPVNAQSKNGRISMESPAGAVVAATSNGAIDIRGARQRVDASTSNGRAAVTLADTSPGPVLVRSSNGAIDLTIGPSFTGELKMSTSNGGLDVDPIANAKRITIQKTSGSILIGEGQETSELRTSNGSIHVRAAAKP